MAQALSPLLPLTQGFPSGGLLRGGYMQRIIGKAVSKGWAAGAVACRSSPCKSASPFSAALLSSYTSGCGDRTAAEGTPMATTTTPRQGRRGEARRAPAPASLQAAS
jgi:hypothetical protein